MLKLQRQQKIPLTILSDYHVCLSQVMASIPVWDLSVLYMKALTTSLTSNDSNLAEVP